MILYVNGDSHSAGCEAVHPSGFLGDNDKYYKPGMYDPVWKDEIIWAPYPDNLEVSYGNLIAKKLNATLHCHARSAGSNDRVMRTTKEYLQDNKPDLIIIGWSTWEREEWYNKDDNTWYQVNGSGIDSVPKEWEQRYKEFIINIDWLQKTIEAHQKIWEFHGFLTYKKIPHLFFNCDLTLSAIPEKNLPMYEWHHSYIDPYSTTFSYANYLQSIGCKPNKYLHFGPDGHAKWAEFLFPYLTRIM